MARIFITGSSTGLGLMAGQLLIEQGHQVVLHGRNQKRADQAMADAPGAQAVVIGDLSQMSETRSVADRVNRLGRFDAVIHNAGVGYREGRPLETGHGIPHVFATNVLAPYVLTALSSGMHHGAEPNFDDLLWAKRRWQGAQAYAESKLHDVILAFAIANRWPAVRSNALEPPHGRSQRNRRLAQRPSDPGVACGQRRGAGALQRRIFLSQGVARPEPDRSRPDRAKPAGRSVRAPLRRVASELKLRPGNAAQVRLRHFSLQARRS